MHPWGTPADTGPPAEGRPLFGTEAHMKLATWGVALASCWWVCAGAGPAYAIVVSGSQAGITAPPADDPGFYNVASAGNSSRVYLGDSWVLSTFHVEGAGGNPLILESGSYSAIPGQSYRLTNPSPTQGLAANSDLVLYRINGKPEAVDPNVRNLSIVTSTPGVGSQVTLIGRGGSASSYNPGTGVESYSTRFDVERVSNMTWNWSAGVGEDQALPPGFQVDYEAILVSTAGTRRWGVNVIENLDNIWSISSPNDGTKPVNFNLSNGFWARGTKFDLTGGGVPFEAQVAGGDSGGGVFWKDGAGNWQLAGILHGLFELEQGSGSTQFQKVNTPDGYAYNQDLTLFSDLARYAPQISVLRSSHNYSIMGDVNLDGQVTGDGSGSAASDDVTAFVAGWMHRQTVADILSWKQGDLDQNGVTNLADFALLRDALGGNVSFSQVQSLIVASSVPEPHSFLTALLGLFAARGFRRRRR